MPVYVYQCENCDAGFEQEQGIRDRPLKKCRECGRMKLHRVPQVCGMRFVGSGFYVNDYGKEG